MTQVDLDPKIATDLPPSSLLVYVVLRDAGRPCRVSEIQQRTQMNETTTRRGVRRLVDADVVQCRPTTDGDARGQEFQLRNGAAPVED